MSPEEITVGSLLEIYINRNGYNYKVVSKIELVTDEIIGVSPIASRTHLFHFEEKDKVDVVYHKDDKMWKWSDVRAGILTTDDGSKLHVFSIRNKAEDYNRRSTYRLPVEMKLLFKLEVSVPEEEGRGLSRYTPEITLDAALSEAYRRYRLVDFDGLLKDLSEGGCAILTDERLAKGDIIEFELPYGNEIVHCRGVVIRTGPDKTGYLTYFAGVSFTETSKNFVRFFYERQRLEMAKKKTDYNFANE